MIGYEIDFIDVKHDENHIIDQEGPFFSREEFKEKIVPMVKQFFEHYKKHGQVVVNTNEYLGNEQDGYDFNNTLGKRRFTNLSYFMAYFLEQ